MNDFLKFHNKEHHGVDKRERRSFSRKMERFDKSIREVKEEYETQYTLQTGETRSEIYNNKNAHLKESRKKKDDLVQSEEEEEEKEEVFKDVDEILKLTTVILPSLLIQRKYFLEESTLSKVKNKFPWRNSTFTLLKNSKNLLILYLKERN
jgi:hypothetical protein